MKEIMDTSLVEARRFFRCVVCSVRTAARFMERKRVPMRTIPCPLLCGKFTITVIRNKRPLDLKNIGTASYLCYYR